MKRGIALSGGGTKGSYELGVWKALNELGIDYQNAIPLLEHDIALHDR